MTMLYPLNKSIKIVISRRLWDIQKNTGVVEKWPQKKEELEKKIKKNNFRVDYLVIHPPPRTLYPWSFFE